MMSWNRAAAEHFRAGNTLLQSGRAAAAIEKFRAALAKDGKFADAHVALAVALQQGGEPVSAAEQAIEHLQTAITLGADRAVNFIRLGILLYEARRMSEAIAAYDRAIALEPHNAAAHFSCAFPLLITGDYERGWREYEWRWKWKAFRTPWMNFTEPAWDGSPLAGKTILLWNEQGFGDVFQFARYATLVHEMGATVLLVAPPTTESLLATVPGVSRVLRHGDPIPAFDLHAPLMSLGRLCGTTSIEKIPAHTPYLSPDPDLVARWAARIGREPGVRNIGLVWSGSASNRDNLNRACTLDQLAPLAEVPGVRFFSLQKGDGADQQPPAELRMTHLGPDLRDFADTAAVLANLDLLITTDTSVPHLAGALNRPAWVLIPYAPDWRWGLEGERSAWYPSLRLFRQQSRGDWPEVIARIALELAATSATR